jgi:hypothetical protein
VKKIVCPRCGAINLEKFVTYPNCAGCNALLPVAKAPVPDPFWRRRVSGWIWATLLGGAGLSVLAAVVFYFQSSVSEFGQLLIYGSAPRRVAWQQTFVCQITLDTINEGASPSSGRLNNVRMRLPHRTDRAFEVIRIDPAADGETVSGAGHYFNFESLPVDSPIKISLRPLLAGRQNIAITVHADSHYSAQYSVVVNVQKPPRKVVPRQPAKLPALPRATARP